MIYVVDLYFFLAHLEWHCFANPVSYLHLLWLSVKVSNRNASCGDDTVGLQYLYLSLEPFATSLYLFHPRSPIILWSTEATVRLDNEDGRTFLEESPLN